MRKLLKYNLPFTAIGIVICTLLIISRLITADFISAVILSSDYAKGTSNILSLISLCLCVHLIRRTSATEYKHVWNNGFLLFLWAIPVFNLLVTALQLISGSNELVSSYVFIFVVTLFSLPTFFCCFFLFAGKKFVTGRLLKVLYRLTGVTGILYIVLRICDRIIFPVMTSNACRVDGLFTKISSLSSDISLVIYILSLLNFILLWYEQSRNTEEHA